ncbi:lytic transglycosylase domain-containing protein [Oceanomicrobium pacificus]|uniref:Transglycosylase SLT domain-containing protein n=1 Tax=Oceanomicrobium pacificus TaxID=2692916 RepID=A0A6B0TIG0_9RHOB|nr:lytic transglycosylase domain-containing protein [Oceanomicrobium pacificus]MXU64157.1 transglycosylase SLT domain-containing protein [Oceanomicrobium pacificus]
MILISKTRVRAAALAPLALVAVLGTAPVAKSQSIEEKGDMLAAALNATKSEDWSGAQALVDRARDPVASDIILWKRLRAGEGTWAEYRDFLSRNSDWPGLKYMRRQAEAVIPLTVAPAEALAFFEVDGAQTGEGALALAAALQQLGRTAEARDTILNAWLTMPLGSDAFRRMREGYGGVLANANVARLDRMLWDGHLKSAEAMLPLVDAGHQALARARIGLRRAEAGVDGLIARVPNALAGDPGLAYERFAWRIKKDRWDDAQELLLSRGADQLGDPQGWANYRRALARRAMRRDQNSEAYRMASRHGLTEGSAFADLEWLSGYLALRRLGDPETAVRHFAAFARAVESPISRGRAGYWLGQAYAAAGNALGAQEAYSLGATYQTSFYGQLAAEAGQLPTDRSLAGAPQAPAYEGRPFMQSESVRGGLLMHYADESYEVLRFFSHAAETLDPGDQAALAQLAMDLGREHVALKIGKLAASMGRVLPEPYYPVTDLAAYAVDVEPELAMAIARQESELNPMAVSPVGAMGLMQVMPATARKVADELGVDYSKSRLVNDWRYNAKLGTYYLSGLLERYDGSLVLSIAAYNAGPGRIDSWIELFGDPRLPQVDEVDWIETIPFRETRNYVMRVMEALHVYRARINGQAEDLRLTLDLSGGTTTFARPVARQ